MSPKITQFIYQKQYGKLMSTFICILDVHRYPSTFCFEWDTSILQSKLHVSGGNQRRQYLEIQFTETKAMWPGYSAPLPIASAILFRTRPTTMFHTHISRDLWGISDQMCCIRYVSRRIFVVYIQRLPVLNLLRRAGP